MKKILIFLLNLYKNFFSGILVILFGNACRFTPTCSVYAKEAIEKKGIFRGSLLSIKRVLKCNPLTPGGYDPV